MSERYKFRDQQKLYFVTPTVVRWMDVFTRPHYKDVIVDSLNYCVIHKGLTVYAWVLMTNHMHLVIGTEGEPMENIMRDMKKYTANKILEMVKDYGFESRDWMNKIFGYEGRRNPNNTTNQFWQHTNHPVELWKDEMVFGRIRYVHENPVRAGYVGRPEDWLYSSAIDYSGEQGLVKVEVIQDVLFQK